MQEVTLFEMLSAREKRAEMQKEMLLSNKCPLVCFTMNIAGPLKNSPLIERAFFEGLSALLEQIDEKKIKQKKIHSLKTGCEAFLAVNSDAAEIKKIAVKIEESFRLGRLFDIDVIDAGGKKLERENERGCIVCKKAGRACAAKRAHSAEEIFKVTENIIIEHFAVIDGDFVAKTAKQSLVFEVNTTIKPGLVDRKNCGSHKDMALETFLKSANALEGYFKNCFEAGIKTAALSPEECFAILRSEGIKAEEQMLLKTGGVNTHKGAIYSMGVICGALGRLWSAQAPIAKTEKILSECSRLVDKAVKADFENASGKSAGERLYLERKIKGIRGEAASGFACVKNLSLPFFENALSLGLCQNDAAVAALLKLISEVEDTNLYKRGGAEGAGFAKEGAKRVLKEFPDISEKSLERLDREFIDRNLSPGGCADLLAVTYFLYLLKNCRR